MMTVEARRGHVRVFKYGENTSIDGCQPVTVILLVETGDVGDDIDGEAIDDYSGRRVSMNSCVSLNVVAIGAYGNDGNDGTDVDSCHVRVYQHNNGTWTQLGICTDIDGEAVMMDLVEIKVV